jgi:hypothetical protein
MVGCEENFFIFHPANIAVANLLNRRPVHRVIPSHLSVENAILYFFQENSRNN